MLLASPSQLPPLCSLGLIFSSFPWEDPSPRAWTLREGALQNLQPLNPAIQSAPLPPEPWERNEKKTPSF